MNWIKSKFCWFTNKLNNNTTQHSGGCRLWRRLVGLPGDLLFWSWDHLIIVRILTKCTHHTLKEKKLVLTTWTHLSTSNKQKLWEHLDHRSPHRRSVPQTLSSPRRLDWLSEVSSIIWLYLYIICVISLYNYIILEHIWALSMYKYWIVDTNVNMLGWLCQSWAGRSLYSQVPTCWLKWVFFKSGLVCLVTISF